MTGPGHHRVDCRARVGVVKARRVAPPLRAVGLDNASGETGEGIHVMARESDRLTAVVSGGAVPIRGARRSFEGSTPKGGDHDA
jgi:hypothetical protein